MSSLAPQKSSNRVWGCLGLASKPSPPIAFCSKYQPRISSASLGGLARCIADRTVGVDGTYIFTLLRLTLYLLANKMERPRGFDRTSLQQPFRPKIASGTIRPERFGFWMQKMLPNDIRKSLWFKFLPSILFMKFENPPRMNLRVFPRHPFLWILARWCNKRAL